MLVNIAFPTVPLQISIAISSVFFLFYMWTMKEPENSLQEPVIEENMDSRVDGPDPPESDIQGI